MTFRTVLRCAALLGALCVLPAQAANHDVHLSGMSFSPSDLSIDIGDTVTFINDGGTHNVAADDGRFRCAEGCDPRSASVAAADDKGYCGPYGEDCPPAGNPGDPSAQRWRKTITFSTPGSIAFHCDVHRSMGMTGRLVVRPAAPAFAITPVITGNWYDPTQNGHGVQFEMVGASLVTAIWFTWDNAGNPAWIVGSGTVDGSRLVMQAVRPRGGRFPPNFDPAAVTPTPWGTFTFTFSDCNTGTLEWTSTDAAFTAAGAMPLTRLTRIQGSACGAP